MITYEVALDAAKRLDPKIDSYVEYPEAFIFTNSKVKEDDNEIVIERKNGKYISYVDLIMNYDIDPDKELKPI